MPFVAKHEVISVQAFLHAMAETKKMPAADQPKMMKGTQLTAEGFAMLLKMLEGKQ